MSERALNSNVRRPILQRCMRGAAVALVASGLTLHPTAAPAMLIDQGLTTLDTLTGLQWLDMSQSVGLSAESIVNGTDPGTLRSQGWGLASVSQITTLLQGAGMTAPFNGTLSPGNYSGASSIIALLGKTGATNIDFIQAFSADAGVLGRLNTPALLASSSGCAGCVGGADVPGPAVPPAVQNPTIGSWLVRPASPRAIVGGRIFETNAFADSVLLPAVTYLVWTGVGNNQSTTNASIASAALTDNPAVSSLAAGTVTSCDFSVLAANCGSVVFQFTDNLIVNGAGPDFTVFDVNVPNLVSITIGGTTLAVGATFAGTVACPPNVPGCSPQGTWVLNAADFDLSAFGIAPGGVVSSLSLNWGFLTGATGRVGVSLIGALNSRSVPEPNAFALLAIALAGLGFSRRRKLH